MLQARAPESSRSRPIRQRKSHQKSRKGCANCKLRSVKCDESKPTCKRCHAFGVRCAYGPSKTVEHLGSQAEFQVVFQPPAQSPAAPLPCSGGTRCQESYQLTAHDASVLGRFIQRTVRSIGLGDGRAVFNAHSVPMALSSPIVMHGILALTLIHDRAFDLPSTTTDQESVAYHWQTTLSLLRSKLEKPVLPEERDALFMASCLISIGIFAHVEETPGGSSKAWPAGPSSELDLSWLKMCDGKKLVWELTNPLRDDSIFRHSTAYLVESGSASTTQDAEAVSSLPPELVDLFDLRDATTSSNPFFRGAVFLAKSLAISPEASNPGNLMDFVINLDPRLKSLLAIRDERALLMLLYWYASICDRGTWWVWRRAWAEGLAICQHLSAQWCADPDLYRLLAWPRRRILGSRPDVRGSSQSTTTPAAPVWVS